MKKLTIIATAIALAIPAVAVGAPPDKPPVPPVAPIAGPNSPIPPILLNQKAFLPYNTGPLTFAGPPTAQEQYRAVCNGTSDSPDAAVLRESFCGFMTRYPEELKFTAKQTEIYNDWLLYAFLRAKNFSAALTENNYRHYGRPEIDTPYYRAPMPDKEFFDKQERASVNAYYANQERKKLIATLNADQAKTVLLRGGVDWIDPYYDYKAVETECVK